MAKNESTFGIHLQLHYGQVTSAKKLHPGIPKVLST